MQPARAKIMGHPIHPMLVVFPIGLYIISFVFDLVYLSAGDPFWFRMAYWTMLGGLVGNVAAAIPGFLDYLTLPPKTEARQIATYHMGIGVTLAILYFANLLLRDWGVIAANQQPWGVVILNLVGVLLIGLQGWLGGELVYKHGVGVEEKGRTGEERFRRVA
ncbi:MAG: DUF2231 domain-containing protein [Candidatus Manganitrophus sp. SA1]|nr:DUF2231 domain-containing protein [Candidatus Manganitrophus morganii]